MKDKITLVGILFCLFISNVFAKSPPLGTGALVPTNIMLMLDNSGSMAWDLSGNQLTSGSFLNNPTSLVSNHVQDLLHKQVWEILNELEHLDFLP